MHASLFAAEFASPPTYGWLDTLTRKPVMPMRALSARVHRSGKIAPPSQHNGNYLIYGGSAVQNQQRGRKRDRRG
jgi:hypothetical protein